MDSIFPERIVRIATRAFAGADDEDIPPGLFGQMWIDFRIFGPVIWGLVFGALMRYMQNRFDGSRITLQSAAYVMVVVYIVTLPLNTGSFDFVFSLDNFFLLTFLWLVYSRSGVGARANYEEQSAL
jgi:hypothetical protein